MQGDPYLFVKEEVEHSVNVVVDLHAKWLKLLAQAARGEEFEWSSSELLSGLRSIEWDIQDLEDTVSIVEGSRRKFQLEGADVLARKDFIEATRAQITGMRDEVQGLSSYSGFSVSKATLQSIGMPPMPGNRGYGKLGSQEELPTATDGLEAALPAQHVDPGAAERVPDAGPGGTTPPAAGHHRRKKHCFAASALVVGVLICGGTIAWAISQIGHTNSSSM